MTGEGDLDSATENKPPNQGKGEKAKRAHRFFGNKTYGKPHWEHK